MGLTVAYTQPTDSLSFSPQGVWDTVYDHLGNSYRLQDIRISNSSAPSGANHKVTTLITCTTNTYFEFYFEDDCGMELNTPLHIQRRSVLCRLAEDLSLFIQRPVGSTAPVRIWVRDITQLPGFNNNVLGLATGFYITPTGGVGSSILDNQVYKTIVSGVDAYTAVATPLASSNTSGQGNLFYHGMMAFNFNIDPITNLPIYDWNTNLGVAPTASQLDLYSVMLHEMTHALGFASLIDINGVSVLGAGNYGRYDLFLRNQPNTQSLIVAPGNGCANGMYDFSFNPILPINTIHPNPSTPQLNNTVCSTAVRFAGSVNQSVYTPNVWEQGSSMSHFEDICHAPNPLPNDEYYVMSNANGQGPNFAKHFFTEEERNALCDLGYQLRDRYGYLVNPASANGVFDGQITYTNGPCNGAQVAGVNDGIGGSTFTFTTSMNTAFTLSGSQILVNDVASPVASLRYNCVSVVLGGGTVSGTLNNGGNINSFTYTPANNYVGLVLLKYIPRNITTNQNGNVTYIYIWVGNCANCTPAACANGELISNGGFENNNGKCGPMEVTGIITYADLPIVYCWRPISSSADLYTRAGCVWDIYGDNSPPPALPNQRPFASIPVDWTLPITDTWDVENNITLPQGVTNNFFIGMASDHWSKPWNEAIITNLSTSIQPGQTYTIGLWAKANSFNPNASNSVINLGAIYPLQIAIYGTNYNSCSPYFNQFQITPANPDLVSLYNFTLIPNGNTTQWQYLTATFNYSGTMPLSGLVVANSNTNSNVIGSPMNYLFIDDVSLRLINNNTTVFNALPDVCSNDIVPDLSQYITNPYPNGVFTGPQQSVVQVPGTNQYDFNSSGLQPGTYPIVYTYTDVLGCVSVLTQNVTVLQQQNLTATISGPPSACLNAPSPAISIQNPQSVPIQVTYTVNAGASTTVNVAANATTTVLVPTNVVGTFTYTITQVTNTQTNCTNSISGQSTTVTILPPLTATISGSTSVCRNAPSPAISIQNPQSVPIQVAYIVNAGAGTTVNVAANATTTVFAPTNIAGTFTYTITQVTSPQNPCTGNGNGQSATITVLPLPTATISASVTTPVCKNALSPLISINNPQSSAIQVVYQLNAGSNITLVVPANGSQTLAVPTNNAGVFVYSLISAAYIATPNCITNISGSATVTVIEPLTVTKSLLNGPTYAPNDFIEYQIKVSNPIGNPTASGLSITDVIPSALNITSYIQGAITVSSGIPPTLTLTGNTLTSSTFSLVSGGTVIVNFRIKVGEVFCNTIVENCVTLNGSQTCLGNPTACVAANILYNNAGQTYYQGPITASSILNGNPSAFTNKLIVVSGALIVDIPQLAIDYCTLIFAAGAEMRVLANQGVIIKNSTLRGCTNMWRGIILDPSATNNLTTFANISNSIVQDAEIGIRMQAFTKTGIHATSFSKCHTGVFAPFATNVVTVSQSAFNGQGGAYLPTFTGQTLVPFSNRGFAGLHLQNNPGNNIGTTTFRDMYYGIRAINSELIVNNCNFQNMQPYAGYTGTAGGTGIYAQSSSNVGNFKVGVKTCNFTTCWYGIYATGIGTDIRNNTMTNIGNINNATSGNSAGIHIQSSGGFDHTINNNNIGSKMSGIRLLLVAQPATQNTRINDNIINLNAPANIAGGMGIELIHPASPASYRARIYRNTINIANANHGISLSNIQGVRLNQNTITHTGNNFPFTSASGRKGILLSGCSIDTISCNTIQSNTLYQNVNHEGIAIGNSSNIKVWGNTMNRTYRGMSYNGTLTGMEIVDNDVQTHFHGWYIGGTMNVQGSANPPIDNGNTWTGPFVGVGARAVFRPFPNAPTSVYSITPPPVGLLSPTSVVTPISNTTPLTFNCSTSTSMILPTTMGSEWAISYAHEVAAGTLTFAEYETETRFALKMELYRRMSADSLLYAGDSILQAFFVQQQAENIGDIYEIEQHELERTELPSPLMAAIELVETQIRDLQLLIENNLNLLDTISNDSSQVLLLNQITSLKAQMQTHENTYEILQMQAEDIDSIRVMQILYHNQGIVGQELYEANMSAVNMLYYEKVNRNIVLTETEIQSIWDIASQCPSVGGNAVFQARGILSLLGYTPDFDDYAACVVAQSPWRQSYESEPQADIVIYPNPNYGDFTIEVSAELIGSKYVLYNPLGIKLQEGQLSDNNHTQMDMSGYISGVYILQVGSKKCKIIIQ